MYPPYIILNIIFPDVFSVSSHSVLRKESVVVFSPGSRGKEWGKNQEKRVNC